ncbi:MAG: hypothetical protein RIQ53_4358 [Pseudomonadota bacterium]
MPDFFHYAGAAPAPAPGPYRSQLAQLDEADWNKLVSHAHQRRYPAGARVIGGGDPSAQLGLVVSGRVLVRAAPALVPDDSQFGQTAWPELHTQTGGLGETSSSDWQPRQAGELFGVLSFLDGAPSAVEVRVSRDAPAEVLLLGPAALQQLMAWQPRLALALLRDLGAHVATRLRQLQPGSDA